VGRATWEARSSDLETWEPSQHSLIDTGKPRKNCVEVAGRRTFRIMTSSQQSGIYGKTASITNTQIHSITNTQTHSVTNTHKMTIHTRQIQLTKMHISFEKQNAYTGRLYNIIFWLLSFTVWQIFPKLSEKLMSQEANSTSFFPSSSTEGRAPEFSGLQRYYSNFIVWDPKTCTVIA
jgi:hypothetical protein